MRKIIFFVVSFFVLSISSQAQISRLEGLIKGQKEETEQKTTEQAIRDSLAILDSLKILELTQQVQQMKLNEMMYAQKLEESRSSALSDSVKQMQHRLRIDSLRNITKGAPLVIENDTLFVIYAAKGGISFLDRAHQTKAIIEELGLIRTTVPDSINILPLDNVTEVMYEGRVIISVTTDDAIWMNMSRDSLAQAYKNIIVDEIKDLQEKNSAAKFIKRVVLFVFVIFMQILILFMLKKLYRFVKFKVIEKSKAKIKPVTFRGHEFLDIISQTRIFIFGVSIIYYALIILVLLITIPMLFSIFPETESIATTLFGYILNPIKSIVISIINYTPNLFTIIIIFMAIKYLVRGVKYVSEEIEKGKIHIKGFYSDWAKPTYTIVRFLLYAFMVALVYPYLPGSESGVFQGISVFVGLIISLGSSTVIGNIIAGFVITYMRPFRVGDRIKIKDIVGNVTEKTTFVTRIRTPKNEIITIPNASVMSSNTTNYSSSARKYGLIIHTNVAIGYHVPWETAHNILIEAAKKTEGVISDMEPFVLETGLEESYPVYQVNAFIKNVDLMAKIYSSLHSNIQDAFKAAGIDLEVPLVYVKKE